MTIRINTNVNALQAQRMLGETTLNIKRTLTRLSSGIRLNQSADGSAELAVSSKLETQSRGIRQALANAHDGINYVRTGGFALDQLASMVQRIRELVIQAANDTYTDSDRQKIQEEINLLKQQIDWVTETTEFNGQKPLKLSPERAAYLIKDRLGGSADISFIIDRSGSMGAEIANVAAGLGAFVASLQAQQISFTISLGVTVVTPGTPNGDALDGTNTIIDSTGNSATIQTGLNSLVVAGGAVDPYNAMIETAGISDTPGNDAVGGPLDTYIGQDAVTRRPGVRYFQIVVTDAAPEIGTGAFPGPGFNSPAREAIIAGLLAANNVTVYAIVPAALNNFYDNIVNSTGGAFVPLLPSGAFGGNGLQGIADAIAQSLTNPGELLVDKGAVQLQVGPNEGNLIGIDRPHMDHQSLGLVNVDVTRPGLLHIDANDPAVNTIGGSFDNMIVQCDNALENISRFQTYFGSIENRLTTTIDYLGVSQENTKAALSRIHDADYAAETAQLTKLQILQQAGVAMLTQANIASQSALQLLQP